MVKIEHLLKDAEQAYYSRDLESLKRALSGLRVMIENPPVRLCESQQFARVADAITDSKEEADALHAKYESRRRSETNNS